MIYSLILRTEYLGELEYEIKYGRAQPLTDYLSWCISRACSTWLMSTHDVMVLISHAVLSTSIIEVYENESTKD